MITDGIMRGRYVDRYIAINGGACSAGIEERAMIILSRHITASTSTTLIAVSGIELKRINLVSGHGTPALASIFFDIL